MNRIYDPAWRSAALSLICRLAVVKGRNALLCVGVIVMLAILLASLPVLAALALARVDIAAGISDMQRKIIDMSARLGAEGKELSREAARLFT